MNHNNDSNQQLTIQKALKDPILSLPDEIFRHLHRFLPPSSIAQSCSTSSGWRSSLHSDSSIHNQVDLSNIKPRTPSLRIMRDLDRLSTLSNDKLVKVSLNLTRYWNSLLKNRDYDDEDDYYDDYYDEDDVDDDEEEEAGNDLESWKNLSSVLQRSKASLKEISLVVDGLSYTGDHYLRGGIVFPAFASGIMKELKSFPKVERVSITSPSIISLKAESDPMKGITKSLYVLDNTIHSGGTFVSGSPENLDAWVPGVMKKVKDFVGGQLTEFILAGGPLVDVNGDAVLEELIDSKLTLKTLNLRTLDYCSGPRFIRFSMACPNLVSLTMQPLADARGIRRNRYYDVEALGTGDGSQVSKLKKLSLRLGRNYELPWESFGKWVGNSLEELTLGTFDREPIGFGSIIVDFSNTIKVLILFGIVLNDYEILSDPNTSTTFPNLQALSFTDMSLEILRFFSTVEAPKLTKLGLSKLEDTREAYDVMILLLTSHASKLIELDVNRVRLNALEFPFPSASDISFDNLQTFWLDNSPEVNIAEWYLKFQYPNLTSLELDEKRLELRCAFEKISPKLEKLSISEAKEN